MLTMGTGQYRGREGRGDAAALRLGSAELPAPVSGVGVPGNRTAQAKRAPRPLSTRTPGPFLRRPPRPGLLRCVPLAGPLGDPEPLTATARPHPAPGLLTCARPAPTSSSLPGRLERPRGAVPPPALAPPRPLGAGTAPFRALLPASSALVWRHFRQRPGARSERGSRERARSVPEPGACLADDNKFDARRRRRWRRPPQYLPQALPPPRVPSCIPSPCRLGSSRRPAGPGATGTPSRLVPARPSASDAAPAMGSP